MNSLTAWMFVSNSSYNKYSSEGALIDYGTLTNTDSHYFDRVMQSAGYTNQVYYVGAITGEQMMVPGYYNWKTWVHYRFSITNIGTSYLTVKVVAGGMWGTTIYSGSVYYDGLLYTSDSSISSWTDGKRNQVTLSSVAPNTVRIWDIMWYADTKTFPSPVGTVTNHTVYVTTVH